MKICLIITKLDIIKPYFAAIFLARAAQARGHHVTFAACSDLCLNRDGDVQARTIKAPDTDPSASNEQFTTALRGQAEHQVDTEVLSDYDVVWIRTFVNEMIRYGYPDGQENLLHLCRFLEQGGVSVVPTTRAFAIGNNKAYLDQFPQTFRPPSMLTTDPNAIRTFAQQVGGRVVLKPPTAGEGDQVFMYRLSDPDNLNQIVEALLVRGHIYAQAYVEAMPRASTRIFVVAGKVLEQQGKLACFSLQAPEGELRSNGGVGGKPIAAEPTEPMLEASRLVAAQAHADGFFFCGIDFVGDMIVEINLINVGGLRGVQRLQGVDFSERVISLLEHRRAEALHQTGAQHVFSRP